uniref:H/ACA ribonucleoprotein complex subunit 2 n=1 Tax=Ciona savignyi TaxID=51511 RepID=H2Z7Z0_CIOSA
MVKAKKDVSIVDDSVNDGEEKTYEELLNFLNPIAKPLASKKLTKRIYKCIKKASKEKSIRRGVKEVQKFLKKGETGFVVFAGDTQPIEVMCHIPVLCEDASIPYCYVPAKQHLGAASGSKRPTCCILVKKQEGYEETYKDCVKDIKKLPASY